MLISLTMGKPALCCREQDQGGEGAEKVRADGPFIFSCSLATHRLSTDTLGGHMEKPGRTRTQFHATIPEKGLNYWLSAGSPAQVDILSNTFPLGMYHSS